MPCFYHSGIGNRRSSYHFDLSALSSGTKANGTTQKAAFTNAAAAFGFIGIELGAIDIRKKYLGLVEVPTVGVVAAPIGKPWRFLMNVPVNLSGCESMGL